MGGPEFSQTYEDKLKEDLTETYENYAKHNESKNIFSAARTPAVLFTVVVACYFVSGILGMIGLETLANLVNLLMILFLVLLVTWLYTRYTGEHRNISLTIDQLADILWDNVSIILILLDEGGEVKQRYTPIHRISSIIHAW